MQSITDLLSNINKLSESEPIVFIILVLIATVILTLLMLLLLEAIKDYVIIKKIKDNFQKPGSNKSLSVTWYSAKLIVDASKQFVIFWIVMLVSLLLIQGYIKLEPKDSQFITEIYIAVFILSFIWFLTISMDKIIKARARNLASTSIFLLLVKLAMITLGMAYLLAYFDQDISAILAAFGIAGFAVALALQDTLANFFAGLYIVASGQIKVGNYLKLDTGEEGYVTDINWRSTTLRSILTNIILVPNSRVASANIVNYNLPSPNIAIRVLVGVGYESDLEFVEKVTLEVARDLMKNTLGGVPEFEPKILFHTFGDFAISFYVRLMVDMFENQFRIQSEFIKKLHKRYKQEGINIPFPIRTIHQLER